ncbi:16S rRNA (cytosine(1402)-N(4))-methyltransferase RsmH [Melioribacter sp. Ez-97]|uniref:16S rRNA (cytosine(1402)-N(4))-methyltransferase RsmH n=1 Tax=Melioribacter sp. Ez-97 TaxID=3423434 RepID=UPI003ED896E6
MSRHEPVLLKESVELLVWNKDGAYFEGTAGYGGHAGEILNSLSDRGKLVATDKDFEAFNYCKNFFKNESRYIVYNTSFTNIDVIAKIEFIEMFDGIFLDLGVSSLQLDDPEKGFTFREDSPLDLRMNKSEGITAAELLNNASEEELADIIFKYGEEKKSRQIARKIAEYRKTNKFETSNQLKNIIAELTPPKFLNKSLARVFQALRIYVNNELEELEIFLDKSIDLLNKGGRIVIITFHSLEDRIVKEKFKYETLECVCPPQSPICVCGKEARLKLVNTKPIAPAEEEIAKNRRARSAKLRAAERI